jgi:hemolysin activation/secretion protein
VIDGMTQYTPEQMRSVVDAYVGREVTLEDLRMIADGIAGRYRADGHLLTRVLVPEQDVGSSTVRLVVVEGVIHEVRIEGHGAAPGSAILQGYAERIEQSRPLRMKDLERNLLLINDLGGVFAEATLVRSDRPGGSDLVLRVAENRFGSSFAFENRGSRLIGPYRVLAQIGLSSLFGEYSSSSLRLATTGKDRELLFGAVNHSLPLGASGFTLELGANFANAEPGLEDLREAGFSSQDELHTDSWSASVGMSYPLVRSRATNLTGRLSLTASKGNTQLLGSRLSDDKLRAARLGFTFDFVDASSAVHLVDLEIAHGFDVLGASDESDERERLSRAGGRTRFSKATAYVARLQPLTERVSILSAATGQYAFNRLLSAEGFGYGGDQFGRAFDASELFGDTGIAGKIELRYSAGSAGRDLGGYTPYLFYDVGKIWQRSGSEDEPDSESAASCGAGVRFVLTARVAGYLELAKPLGRDVIQEANRNARFFFGLSFQY